LRIFIGDLFFYTTPGTWQFLTNGTKAGVNVHARFNYTDEFQIPCVSSLRSIYAAQWLIDREKRIHCPRLYAIWNGKHCLALEVAWMNPDAIVFWIDAGSCREQKYDKIQFPNELRMSHAVPSEARGAMIFATWRKVIVRRSSFLHLIRSEFIMGTFFGGDVTALRSFSIAFWAIHNYFLERGKFVGKDQSIMATYFVYANRAWVQPNYEARCCSWFSTYSFYTDTRICFDKIPNLLPHITFLDNMSNWSFSLDLWLRSVTVSSHDSR
jgi:hypothetical protein